jgi:hypothetical protein
LRLKALNRRDRKEKPQRSQRKTFAFSMIQSPDDSMI